jgi:mono/diheme cytochrome c family protein
MVIKVRTLIILFVLAIIGAAAFVYFGVYNVSATQQHSDPTYHFLHYAMTRSVHIRAKEIKAPDLSDPIHVRNGFVLYRQHCLQCHGAPGVSPNAAGLGTRPEPVNLAEAAREWSTEEIYWVAKNGLKMTAMPEWQYRLTDQELWDITAFVKQLPSISPMQYMEWDKAQPPVKSSFEANEVKLPTQLGDAKAGRHAIDQYLCITCHAIPGVTGADKTVGPSLDGMATRKYIGGVLLNTPENMIRWLRDPQQIDPMSGMPNLHIKEQDLRDIAAYMYTLNKTVTK